MSVRLHVVVEGQTEETYVNLVLRPHLAGSAVYADVRAVETGRRRGKIWRGGLTEYAKLKGDLLLWMKQDDYPECYFTTMVDLCGLGRLRDSFPGWEEAGRQSDPYRRVQVLESRFAADIGHPRFVPYLQMHEFEALLLASPQYLLVPFAGREREIQHLEEMARGFSTPELIDDGADTCPSRRIAAELPQYRGQKVAAGPTVAARIGLLTLRERCRHFGDWLSRLEGLAGRGGPEEAHD